MKRKKLLEALKGVMRKEERKKGRHQAELKKLLKKLKEKQAQLEEKLLMEQGSQKRKHLNKELEIVKAQYAKGLQTLHTLETS